MYFNTIVVWPLEVNCYILAAKEKAVVIDPGGSPLDIEKSLKDNNLTIEAIINTHGHYDHIGANSDLAKKYGCPVYIHQGDVEVLKDPKSNLSVWFEGSLAIDYIIKPFKDNDILKLGGLEFNIIHTPGHTPGSVCLKQEDNLFTGDTLFKQSIGRTDLPGSDSQDMQESLKKLKIMDNKLKVFPGHGKFSTIRDELNDNPYLK